jgi:hypothetical protein
MGRFIGIGVLAVAIVAGYFWWVAKGRDTIDARLCAEEYARARTALESTRIDARPPTENRGRGELSMPIMTCGELRRVGKVR